VSSLLIREEFLRQPKVYDLDICGGRVFLGEDDILKFEISMDYARVVHVVHSPKEFLHDLRNCLLGVQGGID